MTSRKSSSGNIFLIICTVFCALFFNAGQAAAAAVVPRITSVSSLTGIPEVNTIIITGTGFNDTASRNIVFFGAVKADVSGATASQLTVTVPVGAVYTSIFVLNLTSRLSCYQQDLFLPVYDNSCLTAGSNSFRSQTPLSITGTVSAHNRPRHAALGDMDGDGKADLVVCTYDTLVSGISAVFVYRNTGGNGVISYAAPVICSSSAGGTNVKLADLDGDGKLDIIVACSGSGVVSCIRNTSAGTGAISFAGKRDVYPLSGAPEVAIADFDGDGRPDIAAVTYASARVKIFHNNITSIPTGSFHGDFFGAIASYDSFDVGSNVNAVPASIFAADFDKDGRTDIVTSNNFDGSISVLRNISSAGSFSFQPHIEYASPGSPTEVQVGDVDGDGRPEIVVADFYSANVSVFSNNTSPGIIDAASFTRFDYNLVDSSYGLNLGDIDGDGRVDVVISTGYANTINVLKNTHTSGALSAASFTAGSAYSTGSGSEAQGFCIGDMDGDGKPDIAVANYSNNTVSIFENVAVPQSAPIVGADTLCMLASATFTSSHCAAGAGYWSLVNGHATIVGGVGAADTAAVVTGVSAGFDTVVYAVVSSFDTAFVRFPIEIKALADTGIITGPGAVCVNAVITLADTATGGIWSTSNAAVAAVDTLTGVVTGIAPGSAYIYYTKQSASCGPLSAVHQVTVNALPDAGTITGPNGTCVSSAITITASVAGGTWVNQYVAIATDAPVGADNVITGVAIGADTILYVVPSAFCGSDTAIKSIGVVAANTSLPIVGDTSACLGDTVQLSNSAPGGSWSVADASVASVDPLTGVVTGISAGTTRISYTVTYSCGPVDTFVNFVVRPLPVAGTVSGATYVCLGGQITLSVSGASAPGTWSSSNAAVSSVDPVTGVVSAVAVGVDTIYYSVTNSCGTVSSFITDTVRALPATDSIMGAMSICPGAVLTLTTTGGGIAGTWASSNTAVATVATGVVTAVSSGTTIISYTVLTACGLFTDTAAVTVYPQPAISGLADQAVCNGSAAAIIFTGTVPGSSFSWVNSNTSIGLAAAGISDTILFTGTNSTDAIITSTVIVTPSANGCTGTVDTFTISVMPTPVLSGTLTPAPVCDSTLFNYIPASTTTGVTYAWSRAAVTGIANLAATGTDSTNEFLVNTTLSPVVVTYVYTLTINGCDNIQNVSVTVQPRTSLTTTLNPTACSHTLFSYSPAASIPGSTFAWHRPLVSGITNLAASGSDNPNEILYNTTTAFIDVPYTFTTSANGCSYAQVVTVRVQPRAALTGITADTICSGTPFSYTAVSNVPGTSFAWVRAAVTGITPASGTGTVAINDTLYNNTLTRHNAVYVFTLTANGCAYTQSLVLTVDPFAAPMPLITTHSPAVVCANTLYQNFGTANAPADTTVQYIWTADNAVVYATGSSDQYSLVNFPSVGNAVIKVRANVKGIGCYLQDSFAVAVSASVSDNPTVYYLNNTQFVALPSDEDSYQWGYDDLQLDSTILAGEINQDYINTTPDFTNHYYWVMTTRGDCMQKTYYKAPVAINDITGDVASIKLFPNPATEQITVQISNVNTSGVEVDIYNMVGQKVASAPLTKDRAIITVRDLAPGAYIVGCARNGVRMASARFIKN